MKREIRLYQKSSSSKYSNYTLIQHGTSLERALRLAFQLKREYPEQGVKLTFVRVDGKREVIEERAIL